MKEIYYGRCLIQEHLDKTSMTQRRLSDLSGVSHKAISDYINGRKGIQLITAVKLAKVLKCHADELFEWIER